MTAQTRTHTKTTDAIHAAYMAKIANRPQIDPHDLRCTQMIVHQATTWLRTAWPNLDGRPDLQQFLKAAGAQLNTLADRLREELQQGRAH